MATSSCSWSSRRLPRRRSRPPCPRRPLGGLSASLPTSLILLALAGLALTLAGQITSRWRQRTVAAAIAAATQGDAARTTDLERSRDRLTSLSRHLVAAQEAERKQLAHELSNRVGPVLTGVLVALDTTARQTADERNRTLLEAQEILSDLVGRLRELAAELRPSILDDLGLQPALDELVRHFSVATKIPVVFRHHGLGRRLPDLVEITTFRLVQEALTSVACRSQVGTANVRVFCDGELLRVEVDDDGRHLASGSGVLSAGLFLVEERIRLIGGRIQASESQLDSRVVAELPVGDAGAAGSLPALARD